jgi:flagellar motor component MotA
MDKLKSYIQQHREEFEQEMPHLLTEKAFEKWLEKDENAQKEPISPKDTKKGKTITFEFSIKTFWSAAASIIVLITSMMALFWSNNSTLNKKELENEAQEVPLSKIAPELNEAELYYKLLMSQKRQAIDQLGADNTSVSKDFARDIEALDSVYRKMKQNLIESNRNEQVEAAMIQNLQLRIELLNKQLMILENIQQNKQKPEKTTSI